MSDTKTLSCDWKNGFVPDPLTKQRFGFLMAFEGIGLGDGLLAADIEVFTSWNPDAFEYKPIDGSRDKESGKVICVGVIESVTYGSGVGDPICISAYISAENANVILAQQKLSLTTTKITKIGWWLGNYDEENKKWFEESYPKEPEFVQGQINGAGGELRLAVASEPTKVASNIDVNVVNIYFEVVPAANATFALHFAQDAQKRYIRNWGLKIGTQAEAAMT